MATLTSRGYSQPDATAYKLRASGPHSLQWKASCYKWLEGGGDALVDGGDNLPIVGGSLTLDASDPVRRRLTLQLGGAPVPQTPADPLVPFGQFLRLWCRIDKADGSWFGWMKQGEFPITSYVFERPSQAATVEATDYSGRVNEYLFLSGRNYKGKTLAGAIQFLVNEALPNRVAVPPAGNIWSNANSMKFTTYVAAAGTGRWDTAVDMASIKGAETFFDWNGDLVIRRALADGDEITGPSNGPDIGTKGSPVATIQDGPGGNMVAMTATVTREGACNRVRYILHPTKTLKAGEKKTSEYLTDYVDAQVDTGPAKWGDVFGYLPIVIEKDVWLTTAAVHQNYLGKANQIKLRRRGVVRYIDLDLVGGYWLEPDDRVHLSWSEGAGKPPRQEDHYVAAVTFDLSGQAATRVTTRSLAVEDPGSFT